MTTEHSTLLSRDDFRSLVFDRDGGRCVICSEPGADAHHIIERRLFPDGGYYLDNGATLCAACHIRAEMTVLSCAEIREAAGITQIVLPPHLYNDAVYDKWGNILLPNGTRLRGELFYDGSVQKILGEGGVLGLFTERVRYPRTYHLPWSPGLNDDDRALSDTSSFEGKRVVVTVKRFSFGWSGPGSMLHRGQRPRPGPLCRALPGDRYCADRRAGSVDGGRSLRLGPRPSPPAPHPGSGSS